MSQRGNVFTPSSLLESMRVQSAGPIRSRMKQLTRALVTSNPSLGWHLLGRCSGLYIGRCRGNVPRLQSTVSMDDSTDPIQKVAGRTALITGSSQGCGKATALALAKRGWNVVLVARQAERLAAAAAEVQAVSTARSHGSVLHVPCDITSDSDVDSLREVVLKHYDHVDLLVNNAGICQTASVEHTSVDDYERLLQTNFMGPVRVTKAVLPVLKARKGMIINVNSFGGIIPLRGMSSYTASKFALAGWSEALRSELEPAGVHVAQVHPGVVNSDFLERATFEQENGAAKMRETLSSGVAQQPDEIAAAVLEAIDKREPEVVVGGIFKAAIAGYRLTGANPFAARDPNA